MFPRRGAVVLVSLLVAGTVTAAPAFAAAPTVTGFSPTGGPAGTTVTVTGFSPTSGPAGTTVTVAGSGFTATGTSVRFGGAASTKVTVSSSTKLTATVPSTATTGRLTVTTAGGSVTSASAFTVTPGAKVAPTSGPPGTTTTLTGTGFGATEVVDVLLDSSAVAVAVSSATGSVSTSLRLPASATPGPHTLTLVGRRSGLAAQTVFTVVTTWTAEGGGPAHTGASRYENVVTPSTLAGLDESFRVRTADSSTALGLVVVSGLVIVAHPYGGLSAYDLRTGARRWNRPIVGNANLVTPPATAGGLVFVGSVTTLYAVSVSTGAVSWSVDLGVSIAGSTLAVAGGLVYTVAANGTVFARSATTGAVAWTYVGAPSSNGTVGPVLYGGRVYAVSDQLLVALDASDGEEDWRTNVGPVSFANLTAGAGLVLVPRPGRVVAVNAVNGDTVWGASISGTPNSVAFGGGVAYVPSDSGVVTALRAGTGEVLWSTPVTTSTFESARPTVAGGVVWVTGYNATLAVSPADGRVLWTTADRGLVGPALVDGTVYIAARSGVLAAYRPGGAAATGSST